MLPNLPTDNLYKFWALSGLFICIVGIGYPASLIKQDAKDIRNSKKALAITKVRVEAVKERAARLSKLATTKSSLLNKEQSRLAEFWGDIEKELKKANNAEAKARAEAHIANVNALSGRIKENNLELEKVVTQEEEVVEQLLLYAIDIESYKDSYKDGVIHLLGLFISILLVGTLGITLTIKGFRQWYNKVQRYQDSLLKAQAEELKVMLPLPIETRPLFPRLWKSSKSKPVDYEV